MFSSSPAGNFFFSFREMEWHSARTGTQIFSSYIDHFVKGHNSLWPDGASPVGATPVPLSGRPRTSPTDRRP